MSKANDNLEREFDRSEKQIRLGCGIVVFLFVMYILGRVTNIFFFVPTSKEEALATLLPIIAPTDIPATSTATLLPIIMSTDISATSTPTILPIITPTDTLPIVSPIDGMTLLYISAGEFKMGYRADDALEECQKFRSNCERDMFTDEEPIHLVNLESYWIDQTEVTNAMYARCVSTDACDDPLESSQAYLLDTYYSNPKFDNYPVIYVSWENAQAYCSWAERRLPSEEEWEKAAGWNESTQRQMVYPWGDTFDGAKANFCDTNCTLTVHQDNNYDDNHILTSPVAYYENGKSFYGAYDMAGNVWEWTSTLYKSYPSDGLGRREKIYSSSQHVLRGGAWDSRNDYLRVANRNINYIEYPSNSIGFRCAMDADQP